MKRSFCIGLLLCSMLLVGCASWNTDIRQDDDGSYLVTRTQIGFFRVKGSVHRCKADGRSMDCREIDDQ